MPATKNEVDWQHVALSLLTLAVLVICAFLLKPFFSALLGATVLAVITQQPYNWLAAHIPNRNLCAALALVLVLLAIVIPVSFLAQDLAQQAVAVVTTLRDDTTQQKLVDLLGRHPAIAERLQPFIDTPNLDNPTINNAAHAIAAYLGSHMVAIFSTSIRTITQMVVMLFILFFLFRDRTAALQFLRSILPLQEHERTELLHRLDDTIYATALGRLAIAAIQGTLSGIAYWALGVPGFVLWAFCTALLAMVPAFGAFLIWVPIALYLGFSGHWGKAAILAVWGGVIVSTIDNFLYPILVGTRLRTHTAVILISILGGIALFGITGIILGPVIVTLAATLLDFWRRRTTTTVSTSDPTV